MINGDKFSIDFSIIVDSVSDGPDVAASCDNNSNYYMSGGQRKTCCCSCDK